jgi:hypothetical protein
MDEKKKPKYITQNSRGTWEIVFLFFLKGSTQLLNLRIGHITKQDTIISPSMFEGLELVVEGGSKRLGLRNEACAQAKIGCSSQRLFFTLSRIEGDTAEGRVSNCYFFLKKTVQCISTYSF